MRFLLFIFSTMFMFAHTQSYCFHSFPCFPTCSFCFAIFVAHMFKLVHIVFIQFSISPNLNDVQLKVVRHSCRNPVGFIKTI